MTWDFAPKLNTVESHKYECGPDAQDTSIDVVGQGPRTDLQYYYNTIMSDLAGCCTAGA